MHKVVIIGGGAAGLFAAVSSAKSGNETVLIEKNEKLGKKIYITGKGRCNLSNSVSVSDFLNNVVTNPKFLISAVYALSPEKTIDFFRENGLELKVERGNRVFPVSDKASDVTKCLQKVIIDSGVDIRLNTEVVSVVTDKSDGNCVVKGVITDKGIIYADSVIVATGGISYPLTGSTGSGYVFAQSVGHNVVKPVPALCGIELNGSEYLCLQGLSLKNIGLTVKYKDKTVYSDFGEALFTHFGISGPIILSCSSVINRLDFNGLSLIIDLKPALTEKVLGARLIREFTISPKKSVENVMRALMPSTLIGVVLARVGIVKDKKCCEITKEERKALINVLKNLDFSVKGLRPIEEAIVTSGGVNVKEINPKTMESKLVKGLFFAGEVIDVDAFTGGFNLQTAFSTGYLAGLNA